MQPCASSDTYSSSATSELFGAPPRPRLTLQFCSGETCYTPGLYHVLMLIGRQYMCSFKFLGRSRGSPCWTATSTVFPRTTPPSLFSSSPSFHSPSAFSAIPRGASDLQH